MIKIAFGRVCQARLYHAGEYNLFAKKTNRSNKHAVHCTSPRAPISKRNCQFMKCGPPGGKNYRQQNSALQTCRGLFERAEGNPTASTATNHHTTTSMHAMRRIAAQSLQQFQWLQALPQQCLRHMSFEAASQDGADALQEFRDNVRDFAQTVIAPHAEEVDRTNNFPTTVDLWQEMGSFGLLGEF